MSRLGMTVLAGFVGLMLAMLPLWAYAAAYSWRLSQVGLMPALDSEASSVRLKMEPQFSSTFEETLFAPAVMVDRLLRPGLFEAPEYYDVVPTRN